MANAIIDGTDAIMLSARPPRQHPIEGRRHDGAHRDLYRGASAARQHPASPAGGRPQRDGSHGGQRRILFLAARWRDLNANAIITPSNSGTTARMVARFRPDCPIIAPTPSEHAYNQLGLSYGVVPAHMGVSGDTDELHQHRCRSGAAEAGWLRPATWSSSLRACRPAFPARPTSSRRTSSATCSCAAKAWAAAARAATSAPSTRSAIWSDFKGWQRHRHQDDHQRDAALYARAPSSWRAPTRSATRPWPARRWAFR